jgi:phage terminase large subunit-like protein
MWDYVDGVLSGDIVAGYYIKKAYQRFENDLGRVETDDSFPWVFDPTEAARYVQFIETVCIHTRGEWAGKPFILSDWQVAFMGQLFGWVHQDDAKKRRFTTAHFFVARKSGKSQLAAAIILAMAVLDGDGASQFVTAATKRDQAKEVFDEIRRCVQKSKPLSKRFTANRQEIHGPKDCIIKPISSDANTLDGLSLNIGCVDEMHAMRDGELYRVLASSMGSRKSPLMLAISTAGFVMDGIATEFVRGGKAVMDGIAENDSLLFLCYEIDEGDAWDDPEVWPKANAGLGASISLEYLKKQCANAKLYGGRNITEFQVKHCNLFVGSEDIWVEDEVWMSEENCQLPSTGNELDPKTEKPVAYLGLDLAATDDVTALAIGTGDIHTGVGVEVHYFLPERAVKRRQEKDANHIYSRIHEFPNVHITTGNVTDYNVIRRIISGSYIEDGRVRYDPDNLMEKYQIKGIAYDRWNSLSLIRDLEGDGVMCDPFGQGYASMSFPSKAWEKLALEGKLFHGGDEVLRWMMSNVVIKPDPSGNIKVDKAKSGDKIDGVVAGIMAIGEMLTFEEDDVQDFEFFMSVVGL